MWTFLLDINSIRCMRRNRCHLLSFKLLVDFYSDDDIASAKSILFQTAFNDRDAPRLIKRKGKDKSLNNIQDILNIFLEMSPQSVPCYVAKELSRLPPLSMNCFDVSSLVKEMESVKLHLLILQESHETLMKAQIDKCQVRSSPESVSAEHHSPRSACAVSVDMDDQHDIDIVANPRAPLTTWSSLPAFNIRLHLLRIVNARA